MKKRALLFLTTLSLSTALAGTAGAQCLTGTTAVNGNSLGGQLVCAYVPGQMNDPNQRWAEMHFKGGTLGEWGRGSNDPQGSYDPDVGSWRVTETNQVEYSYGDSGDSYTWTLYGPTNQSASNNQRALNNQRGPNNQRASNGQNASSNQTPTVFCDGSSVKALIYKVIEIPGDTSQPNPCGW
jgi:hypothetical protein